MNDNASETKFYLKDDGVGRVYFTWASVIDAAKEILTEYAFSLRASADWHDDRNHHLAEQIEEVRDELLEIGDPSSVVMPVEITIGTLDLEIGVGNGRKSETSQENVCFCGEGINYEVPGDEGGEFTATAEFARSHPKFQVGDAVIGHAQCGLDHGLEPA